METIKSIVVQGVVLSLFLAYLCWLFGIKFSRKKQKEFNAQARKFRKDLDDADRKWKEENPGYAAISTTRWDESKFRSYETTQLVKQNHTGGRFMGHVIVLFVINVIAGIIMYNLRNIPLWGKGIILVGSMAFFVYVFRKHLMYERFYYKLLYTFAIYVYLWVIFSKYH